MRMSRFELLASSLRTIDLYGTVISKDEEIVLRPVNNFHSNPLGTLRAYRESWHKIRIPPQITHWLWVKQSIIQFAHPIQKALYLPEDIPVANTPQCLAFKRHVKVNLDGRTFWLRMKCKAYRCSCQQAQCLDTLWCQWGLSRAQRVGIWIIE